MAGQPRGMIDKVSGRSAVVGGGQYQRSRMMAVGQAARARH